MEINKDNVPYVGCVNYGNPCCITYTDKVIASTRQFNWIKEYHNCTSYTQNWNSLFNI